MLKVDFKYCLFPEKNCNFHVCFDAGDTNDLRRQFVKEKVAKYLSHAEKIYNTYLNNDDEVCIFFSLRTLEIYLIIQSNYLRNYFQGFEQISFPRLKTIGTNKISRNHHNISDYSQPYQSLSKFKVLNILSDHVMLVLCSETQQSYAIKVIIT